MLKYKIEIKLFVLIRIMNHQWMVMNHLSSNYSLLLRI